MSETEKKQILDQAELDDNELEAMSGGRKAGEECTKLREIGKKGGCTAHYSAKECAATVEENSWCGKDDDCIVAYKHYFDVDN